VLASKTPSVDLPGRYFTVYLSFFCGLCSIGTILCSMSHKRTGTNNTQFSNKVVCCIALSNLALNINNIFSPDTNGSDFSGMIGVDSQNDFSKVNNYCLVQSIVTLWFENMQFALVLVLIHVEWHVLVNNDRRPEVRLPRYASFSVLFPSVVIASGVGIQDQFASAFGWTNLARCKWFSHNVYGTSRGQICEYIEGVLQVLIGVISVRFTYLAANALGDQELLAINNIRRAAVQEKRKAHMRYVALGYPLIICQLPLACLILMETIQLLTGGGIQDAPMALYYVTAASGQVPRIQPPVDKCWPAGADSRAAHRIVSVLWEMARVYYESLCVPM